MGEGTCGLNEKTWSDGGPLVTTAGTKKVMFDTVLNGAGKDVDVYEHNGG